MMLSARRTFSGLALVAFLCGVYDYDLSFFSRSARILSALLIDAISTFQTGYCCDAEYLHGG